MKEENRKLERQIAESAQIDAPIEAPLRRRVTTGFVVALLLTVFIGFRPGAAPGWRRTMPIG